MLWNNTKQILAFFCVTTLQAFEKYYCIPSNLFREFSPLHTLLIVVSDQCRIKWKYDLLGLKQPKLYLPFVLAFTQLNHILFAISLHSLQGENCKVKTHLFSLGLSMLNFTLLYSAHFASLSRLSIFHLGSLRYTFS